MLINSGQLFGLPVQTKSGQYLGKVIGVDIEVETGRVYSLRVSTKLVMPEEGLIIAWSAIVEITEKQVIVSDASVKEPARAYASLA